MDIGKILLKLKVERHRLDVAIEALSALDNERKKKGANNKKRYPTIPRAAKASGGGTRSLLQQRQLARVIPIRKFGS